MAREPRIPKNLPQPNRLRPDFRRSAGHLDFIRQLPCIACGRAGTVPAHVRMSKDGGTGFKPGDRYTLPLCRGCHDHQHNIGEVRFWGELGIDPIDYSTQLWRMSGDIGAGFRTINRAHQLIALKQRRR